MADDDQRRIILERRAAFIGASLAVIGGSTCSSSHRGAEPAAGDVPALAPLPRPAASHVPEVGARAVIDAAAELLRDRPEVRLSLEGHRAPGEAEALSRARAARVEAELAAAGVHANRLCLADFGTDRPLVAPGTPSEGAKNRRVEFRILEDDETCDDEGLVPR